MDTIIDKLAYRLTMPHKDPELARIYRHNYFEEHKKHVNETARKYRENNLEKVREAHRKYYQENKEKCLKHSHAHRQKIKDEVFSHYGNKCACCGETRKEFLAMDHINGNGNAHRRIVGRGNQFHSWIKNNNYPEGFQILCHNCNCAKQYSGECPHETARRNMDYAI